MSLERTSPRSEGQSGRGHRDGRYRVPAQWVPLINAVVIDGWGPTLRAAVLLTLLLLGLAGIVLVAGPLPAAGIIGTALTARGLRRRRRR